jgi:hypothetical protein
MQIATGTLSIPVPVHSVVRRHLLPSRPHHDGRRNLGFLTSSTFPTPMMRPSHKRNSKPSYSRPSFRSGTRSQTYASAVVPGSGGVPRNSYAPSFISPGRPKSCVNLQPCQSACRRPPSIVGSNESSTFRSGGNSNRLESTFGRRPASLLSASEFLTGFAMPSNAANDRAARRELRLALYPSPSRSIRLLEGTFNHP